MLIEAERIVKVQERVQKKLPDYLELLRQMVGINSFTGNPAGVNHLGELTAEVFSNLGFKAEHVPSVDPLHGNHLVLTRIGKADQNGRSLPTVALISHLDTVFPQDEERRNDFAWRVEGDRIYGPGSVDIKGGTVLIYMVLDAFRSATPELFDRINWLVLLNAAEEDLDPDFGALCRQRLGPETKAALVFEGGQMQGEAFKLVVARKGRATFRVEIEGRAAHAGSAHRKGANAIVQLAETIGQIADLTDYERGITFNVGTIAGGTVINRVPHLAVATGEMRAFKKHVFEEGVARLKALANEVEVRSLKDGYPCQIKIEILHVTAPWPKNEETDRLVAVWQEAAAELGLKAKREKRGGLSDGNHLWDHVPTLDGLGPAGKNSHCSERSADGAKDQEFALASSFVPKTLLNVAALWKLLD